MFGPKTMQPSGEPAEIEAAALVRHLGADYASRYAPELGEGTRRSLRLRVAGLTARPVPDEPLDAGPAAGNHHNPVATVTGEEQTSWVVEFVLPRGAFATTVLENVVQTDS